MLAEARLGALTLDGSSFPGIDATNLEVDGDLGLSQVSSSRAVHLTGAHFHRDVRLRGARLAAARTRTPRWPPITSWSTAAWPDGGFLAAGTVTMAGARISGSVRLDGAEITAGGGQKVALHGDGMAVGHDFNAQKLTAQGEVRLVDVSVASTLELRGAKLANPGGVALRLDRAEISSSLYCDNGFTAAGEISAIGTHVKGSVYFNHAELGTPATVNGAAAPTGVALRLVRMRIDGDLGCWAAFVAHGTLA